jgi:hypothetical protein
MKNLLKKITFFICIVLLCQINLNAQNEVDALRFSELDWQGTARFMGAGRAFGAVGAEFSAINLNPASIGLYKKSEVTFTPMTISIYKNSSNYNSTETPSQTVKYNLNSAGIIFAIPGISSTLWKKFQIGFGYNRIKNYNGVFSIEGTGKSSIGSAYANKAEGLDYRDIDNINIWDDEMWLAYEYWLISPKQGEFTSYEQTYKNVPKSHSSTVSRTGGNDEMFFSFGTNYDDKLFLGATLGVPFIGFTENRTFLEEIEKDKELYNFQHFRIDDKLSVRATGINLKLGVIYQPVDFLRFGFAFHTPTFYGNVKDYFEREIDARKWEYVDTLFNKKYSTENIRYVNNYNYSLSTPLRAMANVAFFIAQRAFISAEYEITDYSMANMFASDYSFRVENNTIQKMYGVCHTARIGAELNVSPVFAIRAGYNYISSPYKDKINDGSKHYASTGFGFRTKYFYGDFAYALTISKEKYWMYAPDPDYDNAVNQKFNTHRIMMTMGVRF